MEAALPIARCLRVSPSVCLNPGLMLQSKRKIRVSWNEGVEISRANRFFSIQSHMMVRQELRHQRNGEVA